MNPIGKFFVGVLEFVRSVAIVLIVAFLLRAYLVQPFIVDGHSMEPNLHPSDYILVEKLGYRFHEPKPGDVIIFKAPEQPEFNYVKRVIAVSGDVVDIKGGNVYVNGSQVAESYIAQSAPTLINGSLDTNFHKVIEPNQYFVLGDNRDASSDSRDWGTVPRVNVIGRAWATVYPLKDFGGIIRAAPEPVN